MTKYAKYLKTGSDDIIDFADYCKATSLIARVRNWIARHV